MPDLYGLARPLLFRLPPETAHGLTIRALRAGLGRWLEPKEQDDPILALQVWGRSFANPVGLAAGFDKNADVPDAMLRLGFGFVEIGSVTPRPQPGNPRPRVFRLVPQGALINRLGFNSLGLAAVTARLAARGREGPRAEGVVGANLGINKDSGDAEADYRAGVRALAGLVDYLAVNVSSPNTPGLRALQSRASLERLLGAVLEARADSGHEVPVLLKIAPDLTDEDRKDIAAVALDSGIDGLIVSNTTIRRPPRRAGGDGRPGRGIERAAAARPGHRYLAPDGPADRDAPAPGWRRRGRQRRRRLCQDPRRRQLGAALHRADLRRTGGRRPHQGGACGAAARRRVHDAGAGRGGGCLGTCSAYPVRHGYDRHRPFVPEPLGQPMSLTRHTLIAAVYCGLAIAAALGLPGLIGGLDQSVAIAVGAAILVFGAVVHEVYARQFREGELKAEVARLAADRDAVAEELSHARQEVRAIHEKLQARPESDQALVEVQDELRILQELISQLSNALPAASAAADPAADGYGEDLGGSSPGRDRAGAILVTDRLDEVTLRALVRDAVRRDRVDVAVEPIVSLPQRKARFGDVTARIRTPEGEIMTPEQFRPVAERSGLATAIDNLLLFRSIQIVRGAIQRDRASGHFVAISGPTLADADFMAQLVEFMTGNRELAPALVFAFPFDSILGSRAVATQRLGELADLGFRFALDGARRLSVADADDLAAAHVRYVRIDGASLLAQRDEPDRPEDPSAVKQALDAAAVDLIATGVTSERMLVELLDIPIDYGQGPLFGPPRKR